VPLDGNPGLAIVRDPVMLQIIRYLSLVTAVLVLAYHTSTQSQESQESPPSSTAAPEAIDFEAQKKTIEQDPSLSDEAKSNALEFYRQAQAAMLQAEETAAALATLKQTIETAPEHIEQLRAERDRPSPDATLPSIPEDASVEQIRQLVNQKLIDLEVASEMLTRHRQALTRLQTDGTTLIDTLLQLQQKLRVDRDKLQQLPTAGEPGQLTRARRAYLGARVELSESELELNRLRLINYDLLLQLETLQGDLAARRMDQLQQSLEQLSAILQQKRQIAARNARAEAETTQQVTADLPPGAVSFAEDNVRLQQELETLTRQDYRTQQRLRAVGRLAVEYDSELAAIRQRIAALGAGEAMGRLLRRRWQELPSIDDFHRERKQRRAEISRATDRRIDIQEQMRDMGELDQLADTLLTDDIAEQLQHERARIRQHILQLLTIQRDTLEQLDQGYSRYLTKLIAVDATERQLIITLQETLNLIEQELLWIRNLPPLTFADLMLLPQTLAWLLTADHWKQALEETDASFKDHQAAVLVTALITLLLWLARPRLRRRLHRLAGLTWKIRSDRFEHTLKALIYTSFIASAPPLLLALPGWLLWIHPDAADFSIALSNALLITATMLFVFGLMRAKSEPDGLNRAHFRWPQALVDKLYQRWQAIIWFFLPTLFIVALVTYTENIDAIRALARPLLIVISLALSLFFWNLYRLRATIEFPGVQAKESGRRLRTIWILSLILLSMVPAVTSALGYYYMAMQFTLLFGNTIVLLVVLMLIKDLLLRWVYLSERKLRFEAAVRQRVELRAQREQETQRPAEAGDLFEVEESEPDYRELGQQGRTLVHFGVLFGLLFGIGSLWDELLPVFGFLETVELPYARTEVVDGVEQARPLTLIDVAVALLILVTTIAAFRNLAGLLEFTVLRRAGLDPGKRYALLTLAQYTIVIFGLTSILAILGVTWSKLQWLVAALGVGLGFGLQEVVANFVCGIILLLEQPVRVGDIVTVGDDDGTVARINIRATTIITWERKELVVPNKEFITSKVLNWTLSSPETRLLIVVGIAYGSDARKARELMIEAATKTEHVLIEPKPSVTFASFGDNSLNLELRCYISSMDYSLSTRTALHDAIYEKFASAGISIAFPQQDVHLDTTRPLEVKLHAG
jgi:potassium efflux system protein